MYTRQALTWVLIFGLGAVTCPGLEAQEAPPPSDYMQADYAQLDQLVAPIALYPDALVAQILAASTYSPQVVEADHFVLAYRGAPPQAMASMVNETPWDPSVKALTAFPSVLGMMDHNLDWTSKLGNAYYNQPQDVMNAVQAMRQRAYAAGTLKATPQETVVYESAGIVITPVIPTVYYVPVYDPWVVYGAPVPVYPAYVYAPPPAGGAIAATALVSFTAGVVVGAFASYGWGCTHWAPNWYSHTVVYNHGVYVSHSVTVVNHGYYGGYDHGASARAYNHQVYYGANGVSSRTAVRGGGQTDVWGHGPNGGTYERTTNHYAGGNSTTVTWPDGKTASHTVSGRGTGDVTATSTGPNGGTATRTTNHYAGGSSTTATGPHGQSETTSVSGRGTGNATVTRSGARGNHTWHAH